MKKRLVVLLAGLLTVLSMGFGLAQFSDVPAGHWAKEAVESLAAKGIIVGFPDGTYRGNETLTRYQAALIIYRLLQQIEEELKAKGESPTMEAMSSEDLEALKNAVQELAAELAALGVRVSALEDSAATKEDIARLEALIEELKAQPASEPGMDAAALQDLADRVEAASIAADTALAQAQQLAEQLDALAQDVEGVKGDLAALQTQVEANAQAIQALNELAVLLNQDVLALQDRVTALEKMVSGGAELPDLEQFASKEDVAAVQEFAAALRSDLVGLSEKVGALTERVSGLEGQLKELSKVQYSISGSLTATYGYTQATGQDFDVDRLFPGNKLSSGVGEGDNTNGRRRPAVRRGDFNNQDFTDLGGTLNFSVKGQGVEATVETGFSLTPFNVNVDKAQVEASVDSQPLTVTLQDGDHTFRFNPYLFSNERDDGTAVPRYGLTAVLEANKLPLNPTLTLVVGAGATSEPRLAQGNNVVYGAYGPVLDGNYFGARVQLDAFGLKPAFSVAGQWNGGNNRTAFGVDVSGKLLDLVSLEGAFVRSYQAVIPFDVNTATYDDAAYIKGGLEASLGGIGLNLSANYRKIDPGFENGVAGMSADHAYYYFGVNPGSDGKGGAPFDANNRGFGVEGSVKLPFLGGLEVRGFFDRSEAVDGTVSQLAYLQRALAAQAWSVGTTLNLFSGLRLEGWFSDVQVGPNLSSLNRYPGVLGDQAGLFEGTYNFYLYGSRDERWSSGFGVQLVHDGKAKDALLSGLDVTAGFRRYYHPATNAYDMQDILVAGQYSLKLGPISATPFARYRIFAQQGTNSTYQNYSDNQLLPPGTPATVSVYDYTTYKIGATVSTDPLAIPLKPSLAGAAAYRVVDITEPAGVNDAKETFWRLQLSLNEFLFQGSRFSVGYAWYRGENVVTPDVPSTVPARGYTSNLTAFDDRVFAYPGQVQYPWNLTALGTATGVVRGWYAEWTFSGLEVAAGIFDLLDASDTVQSTGAGFKVSYTVKF
ncbi:S-layer homology domain-containing protein [Thermus brockianus]